MRSWGAGCLPGPCLEKRKYLRIHNPGEVYCVPRSGVDSVAQNGHDYSDESHVGSIGTDRLEQTVRVEFLFRRVSSGGSLEPVDDNLLGPSLFDPIIIDRRRFPRREFRFHHARFDRIPSAAGQAHFRIVRILTLKLRPIVRDEKIGPPISSFHLITAAEQVVGPQHLKTGAIHDFIGCAYPVSEARGKSR